MSETVIDGDGPPEAIKDMKLYHHFERVDKELNLLDKESLDASDIYPFDHMNYHNTEAVQNAIDKCSISSSSKVLDIGSGLGGPARYMVSTASCNVVALELQTDCSNKAKEYTERCGLSSSINHMTTNFVECDLAADGLLDNHFDVLTSWLVFLHIDNKRELFKRAHQVCKPQGYIYIEDFYEKGEFTPEESSSLKADVYCSSSALLTEGDYREHLTKAGFELIAFDDMTESWVDYVTNRRIQYEGKKHRTVSVHGEDTYNSQIYFFNAIEKLFAGGRLGGCRIIAKK